MEITSRKTYAFIEIKVDNTETTIFKSDEKEIKETIENLLSVASDLASYTNKSVLEYVKEGDY